MDLSDRLLFIHEVSDNARSKLKKIIKNVSAYSTNAARILKSVEHIDFVFRSFEKRLRSLDGDTAHKLKSLMNRYHGEISNVENSLQKIIRNKKLTLWVQSGRIRKKLASHSTSLQQLITDLEILYKRVAHLPKDNDVYPEHKSEKEPESEHNGEIKYKKYIQNSDSFCKSEEGDKHSDCMGSDQGSVGYTILKNINKRFASVSMDKDLTEQAPDLYNLDMKSAFEDNISLGSVSVGEREEYPPKGKNAGKDMETGTETKKEEELGRRKLLFRLFTLRKHLYMVHAEEYANDCIAEVLRSYVHSLREFNSAKISFERRFSISSGHPKVKEMRSREKQALDTMWTHTVEVEQTKYANILNKFASLHSRPKVNPQDVLFSVQEAQNLLTEYDCEERPTVVNMVSDLWEKARDAGSFVHMLPADFCVNYDDAHRMIQDAISSTLHGCTGKEVGNLQQTYKFVSTDLPSQIQRILYASDRKTDAYLDVGEAFEEAAVSEPQWNSDEDISLRSFGAVLDQLR